MVCSRDAIHRVSAAAHPQTINACDHEIKMHIKNNINPHNGKV